jgi:hypothetical protein
MPNTPQALEDLIERLTNFEKRIGKLRTASVSRGADRGEVKNLHRDWLPISGRLESEDVLGREPVARVNSTWDRLRRLAEAKSPKAHYRTALRTLITDLETAVLHPLIKRSGFQTLGSRVRPLIAAVTDPKLVSYLDESVTCASNNCVRAAVLLAWCAAASQIQSKLLAIGLPQVEAAFERMRLDQGPLFRSFNRSYKFTSAPDLQEVPDAQLILLCRFLGWSDDSQYKQLRGCLDLRNACGHPGEYIPDAVKLQAYYADLVQLVLGGKTAPAAT